jgi:DNA-binding response OmpR family regulator
MTEGKILLVEDESGISDIAKLYLEREGFSVSVAPDGRTALRLIADKYDLVILDLMLPDMEGESICRAVRESSDLPVIMLTARSSEDDRVKGLGMGADDYVVKPFSPRELVARVKALLRRSKGGGKKTLSFNSGLLRIDPVSMEVVKGEDTVPLTATEFRMLVLIAERPQMVFSRLQLINVIQGYDFEGYDRVVDAHIKNIRRKIEDDSRNSLFIKTVYGVGYKFIGVPDHQGQPK